MSSPISPGPNRAAAHTGKAMPPPPPTKFRAMPASSRRLLWGGVAMVGSIFGGFYYYLHQRQERKLSLDAGHPASISTWEYRLKQVNHAPVGRDNPVDSTTLPASRVEKRSEQLPDTRREPDRSHHVTRKTMLDQGVQVPLRDGHGAPVQPAPQRDRGDGLAYTKRTP